MYKRGAQHKQNTFAMPTIATSIPVLPTHTGNGILSQPVIHYMAHIFDGQCFATPYNSINC